MNSMVRLILFTDLDGTLLDHETYAYEPALPVLERLKKLRVPVILASSKTEAEITALQGELGLAVWPAIVENGAGVLWPGSDDAGSDHGEILAKLGLVDPALRGKFSGFSDWSVEELAERTGLTLKAAARARQRRFSEPGVFTGTSGERCAFVAALQREGLTARMGGRFLTLSHGATKAGRMAEIVDRLTGGEPVATLALGDAPNDIEMLESADIGVIVANPAHEPLPIIKGEDEGRISRTTQAGPAGWAEAVDAVLDREME
jgi:mannosyl-3-phosphoglycerate phosphatase